ALYPPGNESTLLTFTRQASPSAAPVHYAEAVQQNGKACLFSRVRNHFLPQFTESLDAKGDHVTRLQPRLGRLHAQRHPGRCSGGNDVTREQRHVVAHVRDELRTGENHVPGIGGLPAFAVDVEPDVQHLGIRDLVGRDEPWSDRPEGVASLALVPLGGLQLESTLGYVIHDRIAGDVIQGLVLRHVFGACPDDDRDLDLVIELGGTARLLDVVVRPVDARRRLHENYRLGGYLQA